LAIFSGLRFIFPALQAKLSTEATRLRAAHAAASAENNKLVDTALAKLSAGADSSFGDSREALALLVSQVRFRAKIEQIKKLFKVFRLKAKAEIWP